jgi:hypothetical protein
MTDTHEQNSQSIKDSVLEKIQTEHTPMHSQGYFALRIVALIVVAIAVLIFSVALCNFILFSLRINGPFSLLALGLPGLLLFIQIFPWTLLVLDILLIILLEWLLRKFPFGYRSPILYMLAGIVLVILAFGFLIDRGTHVNDDLLRRADQHGLPPPVRVFIESERQPDPRLHPQVPHPQPPHPQPLTSRFLPPQPLNKAPNGIKIGFLL